MRRAAGETQSLIVHKRFGLVEVASVAHAIRLLKGSLGGGDVVIEDDGVAELIVFDRGRDGILESLKVPPGGLGQLLRRGGPDT